MRACALMYHDVVAPGGDRGGFEGEGAALYAVSLDSFERQIDAIGSRLGRGPALAAELATPAVAGSAWLLTFDDGGASATLAGAALARRGWKAHFFVVAGMVGRPGFLDWDGVRALAAQGHAIGSHSNSHPTRMADLPRAQLEAEWSDSVAAISAAIGAEVSTASVPGGYYSEAVGRAAGAAGIETLFTSQPTRAVGALDGCRLVGRFAVRGSTPQAEVVAAAAGSRRPWLRQRAGWTARGLAKRLGGRHYLKLRRALLARRHPS